MQTRKFALAFDTVSSIPSVSLFHGDEEIDSWTGREKSSDSLLTSILHLLKRNELTIKDISKIVVTVGPGSLTGIRVGLATAKGLSFGSKVECVGVSNLSVLAAFAFSSSEVRTARAFIVSNQQKVFFQDFVRTDNSYFTSISDIQILKYSEILDYLEGCQLGVIQCKKVDIVPKESFDKLYKENVKIAPSMLSTYAFIASSSLPTEIKPLYISDIAFRKAI